MSESAEQQEQQTPEEVIDGPIDLQGKQNIVDEISTPAEDIQPVEDTVEDEVEVESTSNDLALKIGRKTLPFASPAPVLQVAKRCRVGAIRERNEDSCLVFVSDAGGHYPLISFGLYIVADGMGGHKNGHTASKTASRVAGHHIISQLYIPLLQDGGMPQTPIQEVMVDAAQAAHRAIYDPDPEKDSGTTLTIALILGQRLYVAHVGDSRAYMLSNQKLEAVTVDHSLVQRLQDVGQFSAEDMALDHIRHILLRALGQEEEVEVDTYMRPLPKKGTLLLCSDGLSGMVPDATLQEILNHETSVEERAEELYTAAMAAGGYDNITAIVVDFNF